MGGEGSGRRPDVVKQIFGTGQPAPTGPDALSYIPNYSGLQDTAKLTNLSWLLNGTSIYYNDGNVGIGTTNPGVPLSVAMSNLTVNVAPAYSGYGGIVMNKPSTDTTTDFGLTWKVDNAEKWTTGMDIANSDLALVYDWSVNGDVMRFSPGGNVVFGPGIGSPASYTYGFTLSHEKATASVDGMTILNGTLGIRLDLLQSYQSTVFGTASYTGGAIGMRTNQPLIFGTNDLERVRITNSGNVGIGTTSPSASLSVSNPTLDSTNGIANFYNTGLTEGQANFINIGKSAATAQTALFGYIYSATTGNAGAFVGNWGDATGTGLFVRKGGNVGIGTTTPSKPLEVNGNIVASGATGVFQNNIYPGINATVTTGSLVGKTIYISGGIITAII